MAKEPLNDFDEEIDPDKFDVDMALDTIRLSYPPSFVTTPALIGAVEDYVLAIKDANGNARDGDSIEAKDMLEGMLEELVPADTATAHRVVRKIFADVIEGLDIIPPDAGPKSKKTQVDTHRLIREMGAAIADRIEQIRDDKTQPESDAYTAITEYADTFKTPESLPLHTATWLNFVADAAKHGKAAHSYDAMKQEEYKREVFAEIKAMEIKPALARIILNDALIVSMDEAIAPYVGKIGK